MTVLHDSQVCKRLLISPKVLKRAHLIKPQFDQTHQFQVILASTEHVSKGNLEHLHALYVVRSLKTVHASELLDAGWFVEWADQSTPHNIDPDLNWTTSPCRLGAKF